MPATLLVALNAKYAHTNLAVRYLLDALGRAGIPAEYREYTINQPAREILADIAQTGADRLLFSCYIWNIELALALGEQYRLLFPRAWIALGGPEASYNAEGLLAADPWIDAVLCGDGEALVPKVLAMPAPRGIFRAEGCVDMDSLPFPYLDAEALTDRVLYYESTRGCPFGCAYCLSSADRRVRVRSLKLVMEDMRRFLDARVMKVKFVDRTFNADAERATAIWRYLIEHDNGCSSFQMELGGDLTTPEQLALLARARPGLLQFEIGVQSTDAGTLARVARSTDLARLARNVCAVRELGNIHQHLDLIAGLPGESLAVFARSYDDVFALRPEQLQLGFLKLLRGSDLYARADALGLVFSPRPPYEVLRTPDMSFADLTRLKAAERATELYYNSGRFSLELEALMERCASPFEAMLALGESLPAGGLSQYDAYDRLYDFAVSRGADAERLRWLMRLDLCRRERPRRLPARCHPGASPAERRALLGAEALAGREGRYIDLFPAELVAPRGKGGGLAAVAFDYARRDTRGRARMEPL